MFNFFIKSTYDKKRDHYHALYENLQDAISDHDKYVNNANSSYSSYIKTAPNLSNTKIPSNDFDVKREELNSKLKNYFHLDKEKRSSLVTAKQRAYEKYLHYKELAHKERQEELKRIEKALKEMFD